MANVAIFCHTSQKISKNSYKRRENIHITITIYDIIMTRRLTIRRRVCPQRVLLMLPLLIGSLLPILYADAFALTLLSRAKRCSSSISYFSRPSSLLAAAADSNESHNGDVDSTSSSAKDGEIAAANLAKATHNVQQKMPSSLLPLGYTFAAVMNIAAAMSLIWGSCATKPSSSAATAANAAAKSLQSSVIPLLSSNYHYWDPTFTSGVLAYLLLGTGTCHVLSNLTKQQQQQQQQQITQLQQKQRQRLTMGTILFSIIGMFSIPGEAGYHHHHNQIKFTISLALCQLAKLVTAAVSFIGWEDTIPNGFGSSSSTRRKNILHEIISGIKTSWKTLPITETHPASFYSTCFILVTLGNAIFNIPNLIFYLKEGVNWFSMPISLIISSIGRMSLLSVILFVLKEEHASRQMMIIEGGDDGEKGIEKKKSETEEAASSMFVMLNMIVGLWSVGVGISQGFVEGVPFNLRRAADKFLFGLIFLNNGVLM